MTKNYSFLGFLAFLIAFIDVGKAIIGGMNGTFFQFPYQVLIDLDDHSFECGGGIIGDQFIITAGHCVYKEDGHIDKGQISILAGTHDRHRTHSPAVIAKVLKFYILKTFRPDVENTSDDIAVLKLKEPLVLSGNRFLKQLELPARHANYAGKKAMIAGFGWDWIKIQANEEDGGHSDGIIKYAVADVLRPGQRGYPTEQVPKNLIWARVEQHENEHRGPCLGDSGGPLVYGRIIIGILSSGSADCSEKELGSAYTDVSKYLDFIENVVRDKHHEDILVVEVRQ